MTAMAKSSAGPQIPNASTKTGSIPPYARMMLLPPSAHAAHESRNTVQPLVSSKASQRMGIGASHASHHCSPSPIEK